MNSWMLLMSCFPTMMMKSCSASSMRQPPGPHCIIETNIFMVHVWICNIFLGLFLWNHPNVEEETHIFISHPKQGPIVGRVTHKPAHKEKWGEHLLRHNFSCSSLCNLHHSPSFKEGHIERWRVEIDKLEDEHLEDEGVVILGLCSVHLCRQENKCQTQKQRSKQRSVF